MIDLRKLPTKRVLSLEIARALAEAALATARDRGIDYMVITVVDDGGHLILLLRPDAAEVAAVEIGIAKARTAATTRKSTAW